MGREMINLALYECNKCGHQWLPKKVVFTEEPFPKSFKHPQPERCPKCKTKKWNEGNFNFFKYNPEFIENVKIKYGPSVSEKVKEIINPEFERENLIKEKEEKQEEIKIFENKINELEPLIKEYKKCKAFSKNYINFLDKRIIKVEEEIKQWKAFKESK